MPGELRRGFETLAVPHPLQLSMLSPVSARVSLLLRLFLD